MKMLINFRKLRLVIFTNNEKIKIRNSNTTKGILQFNREQNKMSCAIENKYFCFECEVGKQLLVKRYTLYHATLMELFVETFSFT